MKKREEFHLTELVDHFSHELRTPLSAILGYSEILEKSENLDSSEKEHLEKITTSGSHLLDVINDIIEISNIESGNVEAEEHLIDVHTFAEALDEKFQPVARLKDIDLSIQVSSHFGGGFYGDVQKIKTILCSLIHNAIKFTEKGKIEVDISMDEKTSNHKTQLLVTVTDTGIGISDEEMPHIFKPFWQVHTETHCGTGLGLTMCQKLLSIIEGSIQINSEVNKGTKALVKVPIRLNTTTAPQKVKLSPMLRDSSTEFQGGLKALIVDDLPINRTLARIMLEMNNFETIEAENGKQALDCYHEEQPDVVLMDISMPVMDGVEAMEEIRRINSQGHHIPIIAVTAGGHAGTRFELIERGFSEYIQKPFKESELFEKISLFLPLENMLRKKVSLKKPSFTA
jgi:CheY-like chemotaxis protein/two-component sensor histidine kinase